MNADGLEHFHLALPYLRPPEALTGNARGQHWGAKSSATRQLRSDVMFQARQAKIPQGSHLTVRLTWAPGDRRARDEDNLWLMLKVCCDGLARGPRKTKLWIGLDLVPDDTPEFMTKLRPVILGPDRTPMRGLWLDIWVAPIKAAVDL
ncbi:MAG TPA: hypothetical protein VK659_28570 [Asanoa sp.]|nr:hypothetical protein [Asanoa sp.]